MKRQTGRRSWCRDSSLSGKWSTVGDGGKWRNNLRRERLAHSDGVLHRRTDMKILILLSVMLYAASAFAQGSLSGANGDCAVGGQQVIGHGLFHRDDEQSDDLSKQSVDSDAANQSFHRECGRKLDILCRPNFLLRHP